MIAAPPFIVGNWKMNGLGPAVGEALEIAKAAHVKRSAARVALCPPATLIERMVRGLAGLPVEIGGQDCSAQDSGAFTGEVAARMLADAGASLVIVGHSERRTYHAETDQMVAAKALAASAAGLEPIICVGETQAEHAAGRALAVVAAQIAASVPVALAGRPLTLAYEPVWAIGTGLVPTAGEIEEVHALARVTLLTILGAAGKGVAILYGGSVKPSNIREILAVPEVGGALVGSASLRAADFTAIIEAACA
ncbi:MAG: triose-phosphate isomerase [Caulobacteraceae bacterium]|nr:triose-phosphate isomerase [Caulobacteraceae bacterium]